MKRIATLLAAFSLLAAGAARAADAADAAPAELFQKRCAVCHGKDGKGATTMGQKLGIKDLTVTKLSEPEIANVVANGKGKMTGFKGKLSDADIQSVAKWVKGGLK
jgi:cytochrome c6